MITTRQINVNLAKEKLKLRRATTKDLDAGVRVEPPKAPIKTKSITTTILADVADIVEKKRRDDIAVEKKLAVKDEKKIVITEKETSFQENIATYQKEQNELIAKEKSLKMKDEKKPWKEMTDEEKKLAMKERMAKVRATKARKKKERNEKVATG
jgi:hypothetical protein